MKKYNVIFSDLDGTLINTVSGEIFPKGIWDMQIRFEVLDKIKEIKPEYLLIVSNQGGIESGFVDADEFHAKSEYITRAIREYCDCKCYAMYCETNDKSDPYRKPNVGMLERLLERFVGDDFDYIKSVSLMIGDASGKEGQFSDSDKKTAENFSIDYMDVEDFVNANWEDWVIEDPIESFCHFLAIQGYIPPRNEEELLEFEELHKDYVPRIKGMHVDVDKIINGEIRCEWLWKY